MSGSNSNSYSYNSYNYQNYYNQPPPNYNSVSTNHWGATPKPTVKKYDGYQYQTPNGSSSSTASNSSTVALNNAQKSDPRTTYYNNAAHRQYSRYPQQRYSTGTSGQNSSTTNQYSATAAQYTPPTVTPQYPVTPAAYSIPHTYPPPPPPAVPYPGHYTSPYGMVNNYQRKRKVLSEEFKKTSKKKKKPLSQNIPSRKDWSVEEARRALEVEKEFNRRQKSQSLIIKFPDLELNRDIVSKFHPDIDSVHFQQPSTPRFCFVTLAENASADEVIKSLSKVKFGDGYLSVEYKKDREDEMNIGPEDIDPLSLYVGNLAQEVTKDDIVKAYPKQRRIDIGFAKKMKYTRYAFVCFRTVNDAIEAFQNTHATEMYSKSLIVRFRRLHGTVGMPGEPKPQNPSRRHDNSQEDANTNPIDMEVDDNNSFDSTIVKQEPVYDSDEEIDRYQLTTYISESLDLAFKRHKPKVKEEIKIKEDRTSVTLSNDMSEQSSSESEDDPLPPMFHQKKFDNSKRAPVNTVRKNGNGDSEPKGGSISNENTKNPNVPQKSLNIPEKTSNSNMPEKNSRSNISAKPTNSYIPDIRLPVPFLKIIKKEPEETKSSTINDRSVQEDANVHVKKEQIESVLQPVVDILLRPMVQPKVEPETNTFDPQRHGTLRNNVLPPNAERHGTSRYNVPPDPQRHGTPMRNIALESVKYGTTSIRNVPAEPQRRDATSIGTLPAEPQKYSTWINNKLPPGPQRLGTSINNVPAEHERCSTAIRNVPPEPPRNNCVEKNFPQVQVKKEPGNMNESEDSDDDSGINFNSILNNLKSKGAAHR